MPTAWAMPARPLYERLREKAARRVLRADDNIRPLPSSDAPDITPAKESWAPVPGLPDLQWRRAAAKFADTKTALYYDVRIPIAASE